MAILSRGKKFLRRGGLLLLGNALGWYGFLVWAQQAPPPTQPIQSTWDGTSDLKYTDKDPQNSQELKYKVLDNGEYKITITKTLPAAGVPCVDAGIFKVCRPDLQQSSPANPPPQPSNPNEMQILIVALQVDATHPMNVVQLTAPEIIDKSNFSQFHIQQENNIILIDAEHTAQQLIYYYFSNIPIKNSILIFKGNAQNTSQDWGSITLPIGDTVTIVAGLFYNNHNIGSLIDRAGIGSSYNDRGHTVFLSREGFSGNIWDIGDTNQQDNPRGKAIICLNKPQERGVRVWYNGNTDKVCVADGSISAFNRDGNGWQDIPQSDECSNICRNNGKIVPPADPNAVNNLLHPNPNPSSEPTPPTPSSNQPGGLGGGTPSVLPPPNNPPSPPGQPSNPPPTNNKGKETSTPQGPNIPYSALRTYFDSATLDYVQERIQTLKSSTAGCMQTIWRIVEAGFYFFRYGMGSDSGAKAQEFSKEFFASLQSNAHGSGEASSSSISNMQVSIFLSEVLKQAFYEALSEQKSSTPPGQEDLSTTASQEVAPLIQSVLTKIASILKRDFMDEKTCKLDSKKVDRLLQGAH